MGLLNARRALVVTEASEALPSEARSGRRPRDQVIYYQHRHDRARRTLRSIAELVAKAEQAVAGNAPVKRNRSIQLTGGTRSMNRELECQRSADLPHLRSLNFPAWARRVVTDVR